VLKEYRRAIRASKIMPEALQALCLKIFSTRSSTDLGEATSSSAAKGTLTQMQPSTAGKEQPAEQQKFELAVSVEEGTPSEVADAGIYMGEVKIVKIVGGEEQPIQRRSTDATQRSTDAPQRSTDAPIVGTDSNYPETPEGDLLAGPAGGSSTSTALGPMDESNQTNSIMGVFMGNVKRPADDESADDESVFFDISDASNLSHA
jgi:hypothetical protein